jgi:hypothetical protein
VEFRAAAFDKTGLIEAMEHHAEEVVIVMDHVEAGRLSLQTGGADGGCLGDDYVPCRVLTDGADPRLVEMPAEDQINA